MTAAESAFTDRIFAKSCASMSELPDGRVDCVVTSPPYETQRDYAADPENLGNYRGEEFLARMEAPLRELFRVLKPEGSAFVNFVHGRKDGFSSPTLHAFPALLERVGFRIVQPLYWLKTNARPTADDRVLKSAVEPIYHVVKSSAYRVNKDAIRRPSLYAVRDKRAWKYNPHGADGGNWLCPALDRLNKLSVQELLGAVLDPAGDVLPLKKTQNQSTLHPAAMPDELADWLILYGSAPGDLVLDPFLGSGTTACRAKALGRHHVGYESVLDFARLSEERVALVRFGEALEENEAGRRKPAMPVVPAKPAEPAESACRTCGKPFVARKPWQVSCSNKCRDTHHNARRMHVKEK